MQRSFNGGKEGEKQYRRQTGNKQTCKWRTWIWTKSRANHRLICTCHFKCLISRYNPDVIQPAVAEEEEEEGLLSCYGLWLGSKPPTNLLFILMSHQIKDVVSSNCAASGCSGSENWMYAGLARTFVRAAWAHWTKTDVPQCIARLQDVQCIVRQAVLCTVKSVNRIQTDHTAAVSEIKPHVVTNNMMTMKKSGAFVFQWLQVKSIQLPVSVSAGSDRTAWVCSRKCVMGFTDHFTFSGDTWTSFVCSSHHDPPVLNCLPSIQTPGTPGYRTDAGQRPDTHSLLICDVLNKCSFKLSLRCSFWCLNCVFQSVLVVTRFAPHCQGWSVSH